MNDNNAINGDNTKKQVPLRLSATLWKELVAWAEQDFRSLNGQIEFLLSEAVKKRKNK
ncbi:MAG: Arc family DNA-binding protein [Oscillospiraceae bacterium]|nr:Arc family DNA-binding protein [Oscillospiraceae bacterium]